MKPAELLQAERGTGEGAGASRFRRPEPKAGGGRGYRAGFAGQAGTEVGPELEEGGLRLLCFEGRALMRTAEAPAEGRTSA